MLIFSDFSFFFVALLLPLLFDEDGFECFSVNSETRTLMRASTLVRGKP